MKVIHLIGGGDVGGAKTHVLYLLKELSKHIDVKLISLRPGKFAEDAQALGLDVEVVKSGNILADIRKVARIIKNGKYDIIHAHGAKANVFLLSAKKYTGLPGVTTVHSDYKLDYMHSVYKRLSIGVVNSIALRYIGNYITISRNFKNMLVSRSFNPSDIFILYNGMDFSTPKVEYSRAELMKKYGLEFDEKDVILGIASRLYPVKSIDTIVQAMRLVKDSNPHVKFLIGGDGEDRKLLETLVDNLDLRDTVFFIGWLDDPNELMSSIDISVLSSISESFPYSILEGARFRKSTISTDVGGIPDLITDGENGRLFKPGDHRRLSELILELAGDEAKRTEMGERLYQKSVSEFSIQHMCKRQLEIYSGILAKSARDTGTRKNYDAIISGYYGFRNIGDDALLSAIISDLKSFKPDIRLLIMSKLPVETAMDHDVDSISRSNIFRIYSSMKRAKVFLYGGGNLLQDNTSTRSLFFYLGTVWLAKKLNLKIMFYANGIGPLKEKVNRLLTKKIMNKVDVITLREKLSFEELKHMEISMPRILLTADAALTVTGVSDRSSTKILELVGLEDTVPMVGISLRKYPGHEKVEHEKYENVIAMLADHMSQEFGVLPVFIPMQYPDDVPILENVARKMKTNNHIINKKLTVKETYELISRMDMVLGMRLHALVFAAGAGVPMIGLVYDPKIQGFLEYINQPSAGDVRTLKYEKLKAIAGDVWNRRAEIQHQLEIDAAELKEKAKENAKVAVELISGQAKD
ncbi:MAG: polysaccharide pyruvyl transferase CsaB [Clostridiales bacterium]|nr:polysaccharide pyruvyl transferase CsaB [Clostridiales bacterium]